MSRFIMLDPSLRGVEGHNYEYALNILRAAEAARLNIVLGTHLDFQAPPDFSGNWDVFPVFATSAYNDYPVFRGDGDIRGAVDKACLQEVPVPQPDPRWLRLWSATRSALNPRNLLKQHRRAVRLEKRAAHAKRHYLRGKWEKIRDFAQECEQLFQRFGWQQGDIVYVPTSTEFDLERLINFLSTQPASLAATWHLQFHFNYLDGREGDYPQQAERLSAMKEYFQDLIAQVPLHKIFFYTTTEPLARQYDVLDVAPFQPLAYPVNESLKPPHSDEIPKRLRMTAAGCIRLEKGCRQIEPLIRDLWDDHFQPGHLQLVVQSDQEDFKLSLPDDAQPHLTSNVAATDSSAAPVACIRAPLPVEEYLRLILTTDIGLFLYDSNRYYTRCSGVLVEMLAAGVPVIVPAGCWLSDQISEPIYQHRDRLASKSQALQTIDIISALADSASDAKSNYPVDIAIPTSATHLQIIVQQKQRSAGVFAKIVAQAFDAQSRPLQPFTEIIGSRASGAASSAMIPIRAGASRLRVTVDNAYDSGNLSVTYAQARFLSSAVGTEGIPLGAIGLIAATPEQVPDLLKDICAHYDHYRDSAREFSRRWRQDHHPRRTLEALLQNSCLAEETLQLTAQVA